MVLMAHCIPQPQSWLLCRGVKMQWKPSSANKVCWELGMGYLSTQKPNSTHVMNVGVAMIKIAVIGLCCNSLWISQLMLPGGQRQHSARTCHSVPQRWLTT